MQVRVDRRESMAGSLVESYVGRCYVSLHTRIAISRSTPMGKDRGFIVGRSVRGIQPSPNMGRGGICPQNFLLKHDVDICKNVSAFSQLSKV